MKRALLIIDRGSREPEVKDELRQICSIARTRGQYQYANFCFLEVIPPFIRQGIDECVSSGANSITVMPYFLYPGLKLKETVKTAARICKEKKLRMVIAKPLSYHPTMPQLIRERIDAVKKEHHIWFPDRECDVVLIGHGSSDKNAHDAFVHVARSIEPQYRQVHHCFLELDDPTIENGIGQAVSCGPRVILIMPYFLHKGAHIKSDVINEVTAALEMHGYKNAFMSRHLGVDEKLVDLVIERASEVEGRAGF